MSNYLDYIIHLSFAQWLGIAVFFLGILVFYQRNDKRFKIIMVILNLTYMLHFYLLGSPISALSSFIAACRTATSIFINSAYVAFAFVAVAVGFGLYISDHWWSLFPIVGTATGTIALFLLTGIKMRLVMLFGSVCWMTNNIIVGSIGGVLLESTVMTMNIITIFRLLKAHAVERSVTH
ncbi:YgjV family protein [Spirabiliibacterium pneumoniae]|uniref:YgjV family protein n=1 Tax=Spirabiliibacterium pneumoniae TaxID=221400 RepID=UPI001AADAD38|nr:YgjV family protein [Spirabiliibacterium pneumoniae]